MNGTHGEYEVIGTREFEGMRPGTRFVAKLDPRREQRLVGRHLRLIGRVVPRLQPGSWRLPEGWTNNKGREG